MTLLQELWVTHSETLGYSPPFRPDRSVWKGHTDANIGEIKSGSHSWNSFGEFGTFLPLPSKMLSKPSSVFRFSRFSPALGIYFQPLSFLAFKRALLLYIELQMSKGCVQAVQPPWCLQTQQAQYRFVSFCKQRIGLFSLKLRRYDLVLLWTLALQNHQHQRGLGCTCTQACPGVRACPLPKVFGTGWLNTTEKRENTAEIRGVFQTGKDKQQHVSLQLLSQPGTVNSTGRRVLAWLLQPPLSCSYPVGSGMRIPAVLLCLGLLTVPSRSQNSPTEQVSRRQHAESEGEILGAGNLISEDLTEGLSTTLLSY